MFKFLKLTEVLNHHTLFLSSLNSDRGIMISCNSFFFFWNKASRKQKSCFSCFSSHVIVFCASTYPSLVVAERKKENHKLAWREIVMSQYTVLTRSIRLSQRAFRDSKIESGHLPVYTSSMASPLAQVNISCCFFYFFLIISPYNISTSWSVPLHGWRRLNP